MTPRLRWTGGGGCPSLKPYRFDRPYQRRSLWEIPPPGQDHQCLIWHRRLRWAPAVGQRGFPSRWILGTTRHHPLHVLLSPLLDGKDVLYPLQGRMNVLRLLLPISLRRPLPQLLFLLLLLLLFLLQWLLPLLWWLLLLLLWRLLSLLPLLLLRPLSLVILEGDHLDLRALKMGCHWRL